MSFTSLQKDHMTFTAHKPTTVYAYKIGLPTVPEWPQQSRNWPLPSCVPDWLEFVPESCATVPTGIAHKFTTDSIRPGYLIMLR